MPSGERLQSANFAFHALGAFAVTFVDHEDVRDFHDAGLDRLHIVTHAGNEDHNRDVCEANDIDFILADAYGFNQDHVPS